MALDAIKSIRAYEQPVRPAAKVEKRIAEGTDKTSENKKIQQKQIETPLFVNKAKYASEAPKITIVSKPVAEQVQAAVSSTKSDSIFNNKEGRYVAVANLFSYNTATAGALKSPEQNSSSGDKKDGRNTFISANKELKDIRNEKVNKDDIMNSILGGVC